MFRSTLYGLVMLLAGATGVAAATLEVTTLDDSGPGSLRQALTDSNATGTTDTITFATGLEGTIVLDSQLPWITDGVSLVGPGADEITIDVNEHGSVLTFGPVAGDEGSYVCCLTLADGAAALAGGGVFIGTGHTVSISNSVIRHSSAPSGGGIYNDGTLNLSSSSLFGNEASQDGAALFNDGTAEVSRTTITSNGPAFPAGISVVRESGDSLELHGVTLADNPAGPALHVDSLASLDAVTNSIIAGAGDSSCNRDLGIDGSANLDDDGTCGFDGAGDLPATDPQLGPIGTEPRGTFIRRPETDLASCSPSPVVDAGDPSECTQFDQSGVNGPLDGDGDGTATCDIGAVELSTQTTVTTVDDTGHGSLRRAIADANTWPDDDRIHFCDQATGTIELASPLPTVTDDLRIFGPGADVLTVDANGTGRVLHFDHAGSDDMEVWVRDLTLTGGGAVPWGGGILAEGAVQLSVLRCEIVGNQASAGGGGLAYLGTDRGSVGRSAVIGNTAGQTGGGIHFGGPDGILGSSTVSGNQAARGGGVWFTGDLELAGSTVTANTATDLGGGLYPSGPSDFVPSNTIVAGNTGLDCSVAILLPGSGHNLDSDGTCGFNGSDDFPETDPLLAPLADNGGPTRTHAVRPHSPAVDAGDESTCSSLDQRGVGRDHDGDGDGDPVCDIGAYEFDPIFVGPFETGLTDRWSATVGA